MGWVSALGMVVWSLQSQLCPFGFGSSASWAVGVPRLVTTEVLEVEQLFYSFQSYRAQALTFIFFIHRGGDKTRL